MRKSLFSIILLMTILITGSSFSYANLVNKNDTQMIVILINHLSFEDYTIYRDVEGFRLLEQQAAKGAMNINTGGSRNDANAYLTIGGGSRGVSAMDIGNSFLATEFGDEEEKIQVKEQYRQQTGKSVSDQSILFLSMSRLIQEQNQKYPFFYGITGELLKQKGITAKVFGNQDTDEPKRYAPLLIMDQEGQSLGDVGDKTTTIDQSRPFGIKTNYEFLYQRFLQETSSDTSLLVFDLGDLYRLDQFKKEMDIGYYTKVRQTVIQEQGNFIDQIYKRLSPNQQLLVLAPMVSDQASEGGYLLAPIWWRGPNLEGNILISNSTKRAGIISNVDIAPTVLMELGITNLPGEMVGQKIASSFLNRSLMDELNQIFHIYQQRADVLYPYVIWQVVLLLSSILVWMLKIKKAYSFMQIGLIGMLNLPLLFLVTSSFFQLPSWLYLILLLTLSLLFGLGLRYLNSVVMFFWIGFLTWITISMDVSFGSFLMKRSYLGYDPIIGARYYGIGNEYMGVYIGAALLFTMMLLHQRKSRDRLLLVGMIYLVVCYFLLSPSLGTNAGGAISAIVATSFTFLQMNNRFLNKRGFLLFISIVILGIGGLLWVNLSVGVNEQSHIGRAFHSVTNGDISSIYQLIVRKLAMNWKLIQVSSWSKVMIASLVVIGILFIRPRGAIKKFFEQSPHLFYGFYGIIVGAITALIFNDSGIVAASTMIIFIASPILYIAMEEKG